MTQAQACNQGQATVTLALVVDLAGPLVHQVGFIDAMKQIRHVIDVHRLSDDRWMIRTDLPPAASELGGPIVRAAKAHAPSYM